MKIPMIFCNRDTVALLLAYHSAIEHLKKGFKGFFICIIFAIPCILLTILDLILGIFKKKV